MAGASDGRLVYDFGMNIAEDAGYYLKRGFRVVAIEADPAMCVAAAERFASQIADGSLTIVNRAIGRERGLFKFHVCDTMSAWSTASDELRDHWASQGAQFRTIEVEFGNAGEIIDEHGAPYFVKIDIEGHDEICIEQLDVAGHRPPWLSFELDVKRARSAVERLARMGYERFALVDQSTVPQQRIPANSREGATIDYQFRIGQSGMFGTDLDVPWISTSAMLARLRSLSLQGKAAKLVGLINRVLPKALALPIRFPSTLTWYDLHARSG